MTYLFRAFAESLNITQLTNAKLSQSLWISWPAAIVISGASLFSPCIHAGRKSAARLFNFFFSRKDEGWSDGCLWWSSSILPSGTVDYMLVLVWKWLFAIYLCTLSAEILCLSRCVLLDHGCCTCSLSFSPPTGDWRGSELRWQRLNDGGGWDERMIEYEGDPV